MILNVYLFQGHDSVMPPDAWGGGGEKRRGKKGGRKRGRRDVRRGGKMRVRLG